MQPLSTLFPSTLKGIISETVTGCRNPLNSIGGGLLEEGSSVSQPRPRIGRIENGESDLGETRSPTLMVEIISLALTLYSIKIYLAGEGKGFWIVLSSFITCYVYRGGTSMDVIKWKSERMEVNFTTPCGSSRDASFVFPTVSGQVE